jgi:tetratricopeptide (TPR) repeat protein
MDVQLLETRLARRPYSPLFARIAEEYLSQGRIDDAKELCLSGIEKYPRYTTAHLILAKCFAAEQNYSSAIQSLDYVTTIFPDSQTVNSLLDDWRNHVQHLPSTEDVQTFRVESPVEAITKIENEIQPVKEELTVVTQDVQSSQPEMVLPPVIQEIAQPVEEEAIVSITDAPTTSQEIAPSTIDQEVPQVIEQQVATHISEEELAQIERPPTTLSDEGRIVSKTLAEIYAMQGEFSEAIITYQLLKQQRPERVMEFDQRIGELEEKMKGKIVGQ